MRARRTTAWRRVGVLIFFALLTVVHTWPLALHVSSHVSPAPDVRVNIWALNDQTTQLLTEPSRPFDGRIFYPYPRTLAFVDHQITNSLLAMPLVAAGLDPITVYNLVLLATFFLSGLFAYALGRDLTGSVLAGLVTGSLFAFSSYRFFHFEHLHLLGTHWLPLALVALHRFLARPTGWRLGLLVVSGLLVAWSSWQLAVIGSLGLLIVAVWTLMTDGQPVGRRATALVAAVTVVGLTLIPLAAVYATASAEWGRPGGETTGSRVDMSIRPDSFLTPTRGSRAPYAPWLRDIVSAPPAFPGVVALGLTVPALWLLLTSRRDTGWTTRSLFWLGCLPAIVVLVAARLGPQWTWVVEALRPIAPVVILAATVTWCGVRFARRIRGDDSTPSRVVVATYLAMAVAGGLLALGPYVLVGDVNLGRGVYWPDGIPPLSLLRAPERFTLLLTLGVSVLAGVGLMRVVRGRTGMAGLLLGGVALTAVNVDTWKAPVPLDPVPRPRPPVYAWLANTLEPGAVLEYPWNNQWSVYNNLAHGRRFVHGRAYIEPHRLRVLKEWPALTPRHLTQLWEHFHPRYILLRSGIYPDDVRAEVMRNVQARPDALQLRARFGDDYVFELIDRGFAPRLYRIWPREALSDRPGFAMNATVTDAREGTVPGVVVTMNGATVFERWGPETARAYPYVMWVDPDRLIPGLNTLEVRADYRFGKPQPGHLIGTTGVELAADVVVTSERDRATVEVNGHLEQVDKGYFLAVLDARNGQVVDKGWFNTSWYRADSDRLVDFVDAIPPGAPVVVASEFDVSRQLTVRAVEALKTLGLRNDLTGRVGWVHAAVGVKGATPGSALESVDRRLSRLTLGELARPRVQLRGLSVQ